MNATGPAGVDELHRDLEELGLTASQASVLLALLFAGRANSIQLSVLTKVPRTSIYKVMETLTGRGLANPRPSHGATVWASPGWETVIDILDDAAEERLRQYQARSSRLRRELAELLSRYPPGDGHHAGPLI